MAEVTIQKPQQAEDAAHVAAMIARADGLPAPVVEAAVERPAWLPEGFDTPEALAAAYAATLKPAPAAPAETPAATAEPAAAAEAVASAGLDMAALEAKVVATGQLEASDYAALEAAGISRTMADQYIAGQQAIGEAITNRAYAHVGGADKFNAMLEWAGAGGLTPAEAEAFNSVADSGTEASLMLALDGLRAKFVAAGGNTPALMGGNRGGASLSTYESIPQMIADMNNPQYSRDPAFRAQVEAKIARSDIF